MDCIFSLCTDPVNRVMVLNKAPKVAHTNVGKLLGKPEDYAMMALKVVLKNKNKIDASIPLPVPNAAQEPPKPQSQQTEEMKVEKAPDKPATPSVVKTPEPSITLLKDLKKDQSKWTIKIRVTKKHDPRSCKAGTGKMQKINLVDQCSTEMSVLLFDDAVVSVGENLVEGGVTFYISQRTIRFIT